MFKHPVRPPELGPGRFSIALPGAVCMAAVLFLLLWGQRGGALVDDAYISFRYAARWAGGAGLTWNDGVAVEGFSNPLWTLGLGLIARLGLPPHVSAPWLGLVALLGMVGLAGALARRRALAGPAALILLGGPAADVGLVLWAGSGLETVSGALLTAAWLWVAAGLNREGGSAGRSAVARGTILGLLGSALALSRPEGGLWALWGLIWLIWGAWVGKRVLGGWALGIVPALAYMAYRWSAYGSLVPNTFFAKMEPVGSRSLAHGAQDLGGWAMAHAVPLILLILFRWQARDRGKPAGNDPRAPRCWLFLPAGWVVVQALFVLAAGGDWMGRARYFVPALPALYLLVAEGWPRGARSARIARPGLALAVLLAVHLALGWAWRDVIPRYTAAGRDVGLWLRSVADPGDVVAVTAAGAVPYYAGLPAYDILGINDPEVVGRRPRHTGAWAPGHHRYDLDRLLELRPRWIVWDFGIRVNEQRIRELREDRGNPDRLDYRRALLARPEFRRLYAIDKGVPVSTQGAYTVFRRR